MLGKYLKKHRLDLNLSQAEMAKRLKTSQSYYCMIENGAAKPGIQFIRRIAKELRLDPSVVRAML